MRTRRLTSAGLGRGIRGAVADKHNIKRVDRLLGNRKLHAEMGDIYGAMARKVLGRMRRPLISVDWTDAGNNFEALVATIAIDGRSLPIYGEVHPIAKGTRTAVEMAFVVTLKERIVPEDCRPIIVADAGFRCPWWQAVASVGWDFVGRISSLVKLAPANAQGYDPENHLLWRPARAFFSKATSRAKNLGAYYVSRRNGLQASLVRYKNLPKKRQGARSVTRKGVHPGSSSYKKYQRRAQEPWLLVTSLKDADPRQVVKIYARRMTIEETFRDMKSHRFGWSYEDARCKSAKRIAVLFLIAALAMSALILAGWLAEKAKIQRHFSANTIRKRRVLSYFYLGNCILFSPLVEAIRHHLTNAKLEDLEPLLARYIETSPEIGTHFVGIR